VASYSAALFQYERWAERHGVSGYPASYDAATLYITHLALLSRSAGMADRAAAAIRAEHRRRNLPSPTDEPGAIDMMRGIHNAYGHPPEQVEPLTGDQLKKMLGGLVSRRPSPVDMRTAWLALICYQMTSRCGDVKRLRVRHFTFNADGTMLVRFDRP